MLVPKRVVLVAAVTMWGAAFVAAQEAGPGAGAAAQPTKSEEDFARLLPEAPGRELVRRRCAEECHTAQPVAAHSGDRDYWERIAYDMALQGAEFSDEEQSRILDYLSTQFPPRLNINAASARAIETQLRLSEAEAAAIVAYRTANGRFASLDALKQVPGVSADRIDAVSRRLMFGGR